MKRRILFGKWLAVFAVCVMGGEVFAQTTGNLLTNGDANNGLAGWVDPADAWSVVTSESGMSPIDGPWFWPKRRSSASSYVLYQDVSIRAYVGRTVTLSAYAHGWNGQSDKSQLRLEFLNSSGSVLDAAESGVVQGHGWRQLSVSRAVPSGAVTARVKLIGRDYNSMCDSHFDKISLVAGGTVTSGTVTSGTVTGGSSTTRPSGTTSTGTAAFGIGFYLDAGEKIQLSAPSGATWSSSNSSVAKVNSRGIVTAVSEGTAVITATSGGNRSSITVQVSD